MPGSSGRLGGALLAVCRLEQPETEVVQRPEFSLLLRRHRLQPLAHLVTSRAGAPSIDGTHQVFLEAVGAHTRNLASLRALSAALHRLAWVVLKGPVLSQLAHPVPGVRHYADIDVLVAPTDLRACVDRLERAGWQQLDGNHRLLLERMPGELHFLGPHGAQVDLHWSLLNNREARASFRLPAADLLSRRTTRQVAQFECPTLDDVDFLLHLCVHAAHSGADRLLWLLDVDQWVRRVEPDWQDFLQRAEATGTQPSSFVVLGRARRALGSPIPQHVFTSLSSHGLWHLAETVVRNVEPVERITRDRSAAKLIARASRQSGASSSREFLRRMSSSISPKATSDTSWRDEPDAEAWEQFLSRVGRES
jgi:hypothetical protein